jgi:Peptidase propeptide and YPEB domain
MRSYRRPTILLVATVLSLGTTCVGPSPQEISRERAIEIAQPHLSFQPDSTEAERASAGARPVWRVTFRGRLPNQPPGLFETAIVEVDRQTGEIVSISRT